MTSIPPDKQIIADIRKMIEVAPQLQQCAFCSNYCRATGDCYVTHRKFAPFVRGCNGNFFIANEALLLKRVKDDLTSGAIKCDKIEASFALGSALQGASECAFADVSRMTRELRKECKDKRERQLLYKDAEMADEIIYGFHEIDKIMEELWEVYDLKMQELMETDRAKHNVLPHTKFGLMQITRQRVRPATEINTMEVCPVCNGTGKISSSVVVDEAIERRLSYYVTEKNITNLTLKVNPILGAYLTKGLFSSIVGKWKKKYRCRIEVAETTDFSVLQNEFYDEKGGKLD